VTPGALGAPWFDRIYAVVLRAQRLSAVPVGVGGRGAARITWRKGTCLVGSDGGDRAVVWAKREWAAEKEAVVVRYDADVDTDSH